MSRSQLGSHSAAATGRASTQTTANSAAAKNLATLRCHIGTATAPISMTTPPNSAHSPCEERIQPWLLCIPVAILTGRGARKRFPGFAHDGEPRSAVSVRATTTSDQKIGHQLLYTAERIRCLDVRR